MNEFLIKLTPVLQRLISFFTGAKFTWNPQIPSACTNGTSIQMNPSSRLFQGLNDSEKKSAMIHTILHEISHILYTPMGMYTESRNKQKYSDLYHTFCNTCEDGYIECAYLRDHSLMRKEFREGRRLLMEFNSISFEEMVKANMDLPSVLFNVTLFYALYGVIIIPHDEIQPYFGNLTPYFWSLIEKMDSVLSEDNPKRRVQWVEIAFEDYLEILKKYHEEQKAKNQNKERQKQKSSSSQKSEDSEEGNNSDSNDSQNNESQDNDSNSGNPVTDIPDEETESSESSNGDNNKEENSSDGNEEDGEESGEEDEDSESSEDEGENSSKGDGESSESDNSEENGETGEPQNSEGNENSENESNAENEEESQDGENDEDGESSDSENSESDSTDSSQSSQSSDGCSSSNGNENTTSGEETSEDDFSDNPESTPLTDEEMEKAIEDVLNNIDESLKNDSENNDGGVNYKNTDISEDDEKDEESALNELAKGNIPFDRVHTNNYLSPESLSRCKNRAKTMTRILKKELRDETDEEIGGLSSGKRLDKRHLYREDGKILSKKLEPESVYMKVAMMVDISGSMGEMENAREITLSIYECCEELGIAFEGVAFNGYMSSFMTKKDIINLRGHGGTEDVTPYKFLNEKLTKEKEYNKKMIIVVTDGFGGGVMPKGKIPTIACGISGTNVEGRWGHTAKIIASDDENYPRLLCKEIVKMYRSGKNV